VLALYDGPLRQSRSSEWLDVIDAASLLWRLSLAGIDVSERASLLSEDIEPPVDEPVYIFIDWHAVMVMDLPVVLTSLIGSSPRAAGRSAVMRSSLELGPQTSGGIQLIRCRQLRSRHRSLG